MSKVMLVEDDNNLREIYEARLAAEGYQIISAQDGEEALALAVKEKPDLIISDVMMPKISGFDMLDILRSTPEVKDTKVIMMTALGQAEDRTRADKLGADRYLVKSQVTLEDVVKVAHDILGDKPGAAPAPASATPAADAAPGSVATPDPTAVPAVTDMPVVSEPPAVPAEPAATPAPDDTPPISPDPTPVPVSEPVGPAPDPSAVPELPTPTAPEAPAEPAAPETPAIIEPTPVDTPTDAPAPETPSIVEPTPETPAVVEPSAPEATPTAEPLAPTAESTEPVETSPVEAPMVEPTGGTPPPAEADAAAVSDQAQTGASETDNVEKQIQDFIANGGAAAPAADDSQTKTTTIPITLPVDTTSNIDLTQPPQPPVTESKDSLASVEAAVKEAEKAPVNQTEVVSSHQRVLKPTENILSPGVDLNALLAKEEEKNTVDQPVETPPTNSVIKPEGGMTAEPGTQQEGPHEPAGFGDTHVEDPDVPSGAPPPTPSEAAGVPGAKPDPNSVAL